MQSVSIVEVQRPAAIRRDNKHYTFLRFILLKVSPYILGVVFDVQATAETNCLFQDASNKPSFISLTHADRNTLFFMFQNTNDLSCATVLLKLSKKVSRFDGMCFGGNV